MSYFLLFTQMILIPLCLGGMLLMGTPPLWGSSCSDESEKKSVPATPASTLQHAKLMHRISAQTGFPEHFKSFHWDSFKHLSQEALQGLYDSKYLEGSLAAETPVGQHYDEARQVLEQLGLQENTRTLDIALVKNNLFLFPPIPVTWSHLLTTLNISDNNLVALDVSNLPALKQLKAARNKLEVVLGISQSTSLFALDLSNNNLQKVEGVNNHPTLTHLDLCHNPLGTLAWLQGAPKLQVLSLIKTQLTQPPLLAELPNLLVINLSENQLTQPPLLGTLSGLMCLNLASNRLTQAPPELSRLTNLEIFSVADNAIQSAPGLEFCTKLKGLSLAQNGFTELPPLSALNNLRTLKIHGNRIETFPDFSHMTVLGELRLDHNPAVAIPGLATLTTLKQLSVSPAQWADPENNKNYRKLLNAQNGKVNAVRVEQPD